MTPDERMRLAQRRGQVRFTSFDEQIVRETGFATLDEELWKPILSAEGLADPEVALEKLDLLATDERGVTRATVAGVLVCTAHPEQFLPNAGVTAVRYRGADRSSGQVDAQEITGPIDRQITQALAFAVRNMQAGARKTPARETSPSTARRRSSRRSSLPQFRGPFIGQTVHAVALDLGKCDAVEPHGAAVIRERVELARTIRW